MYRSRNRWLTALALAVFPWALPDVPGSTADRTAATDRTLISIRQEYNAVSSQIDSLVGAMNAADPGAVDDKRLPRAADVLRLPEGTSVVCIFWADDEARVWLNDFLVGETRLTPVEIEIPRVYLKNRNRIRARCWDTDHVESGFLFGLYLKNANGALHPILVSDDTWQSTNGPALEIIYAHPVPDIPSARIIWHSRIFGQAEFVKRFSRRDIEQALSKTSWKSAPNTKRKRMDYHSFVQSLLSLQETRAGLERQLRESAGPVMQPAYDGHQNPGISLTLGKAGPLKEEKSLTFAKEVKLWAEKLAETEKRLVYPRKRALKGEGALIAAAGTAASGTEVGDRRNAYRPPEERSPGEKSNARYKGRKKDPAASEPVGSAGSSGRASRAGLLLPTIVIAAYVGFVISKSRDVFRV